MACVEEDDFCFVEPIFYDEARDLARRARALEKKARQEEEKARQEEEKARKAEERRRRGLDHKRVMASIVEYDPKTKRKVCTRYSFNDFSVFDINEESPIPPMRYTKRSVHGLKLRDTANILTVKIVSSDKGFPINVYGTIIARDSIDHKCMYLFNRTRDNCQPIKSRDENLILTGPGRGLVLLDFIYLEIDLKIKVGEEPLGEQISKGLLMIDGRVLPRGKKASVAHQTLESWFSTVDVRYATLLHAVEGTFEIKLLEGRFCGNITAGINGIQPRIVIYNSKEDGVVSCEGRTDITLRRRVMTLRLDGMLTLGFAVRGLGGAATRKQKVEFTPQHRGEEKKEFSCGTAKLQVKVFWSMLDYRR
ncbi:hypothetical protein CFC21_009871 [Triticum aestivum]|uniref:DUF6598 domain-containing protein n=2 Tax=Triticum aestivum TaxID=4565 RepID=A0A9R1DJ53_WHEAT|nr:uncharacterized protein LOC123179889 [Triticum aestivum]XP_044447730.1 uncharacterized protein LOC123179891 [Triticum aestivum]KAF6992914.1 hypothetical protein CFC21_009867 [Triticum aestivum]KAF6992918.1 hypothetical protein CFC21_009871 [Triticum aestivum]